jgi:putative peptidoglycan lipid II flippase
VQRILRLMVPGIVGSSMSQVSLLLDTVIASMFVTGSITWLYLADRIMEFPLGVFSIALGTVILPGLSMQHAKQDGDEFSDTLDWALRLTVMLVAPAAIGMLFFAGPMVTALFGFRKMTLIDMQMSSWALMAYSWGLMTFSLIKVMAPGYYARQDTKAPVRAAIAALILNMTLNVCVAWPASRLGFVAPHILIATSTCISSALNAFLLWRGLRRSGVYHPTQLWARLLPRVLLGCLLMAALLWWMNGSLADWMAMRQWERLLRCLGGIAAAAVLYFAVLWATGLRPGDLRHRRATT